MLPEQEKEEVAQNCSQRIFSRNHSASDNSSSEATRVTSIELPESTDKMIYKRFTRQDKLETELHSTKQSRPLELNSKNQKISQFVSVQKALSASAG